MRGIVFDIDDTLYCRQDMLVKAAETVLGVKVDDWHEFITIFYGEDANEEDAQALEAVFAEFCPDAEISVLPGNQPVYYYIISIE